MDNRELVEWKYMMQSYIKKFLLMNLHKRNDHKEEIWGHGVYTLGKLNSLLNGAHDLKVHNCISDSDIKPHILNIEKTLKILIERLENFILKNILD